MIATFFILSKFYEPPSNRISKLISMHNRLFIVLIITLLSASMAWSQEDDTERNDEISRSENVEVQPSKPRFEYPRRRIGFTPSALGNRFPGIQISNDWGLKSYVNFGIETGYLFTDIISNTTVAGFRVRPTFDFAFIREKYIALSFGLGFNYRYTIENERSDLFNNQDEYFEVFLHKKTKSLFGFVGTGNITAKLSDRVYAELGGGIGLGELRIRQNLPDRANNFQPDWWRINTIFDSNQDEDFNIIVFFLHLNVSYALFKDEKKGKNKYQKEKTRVSFY